MLTINSTSLSIARRATKQAGVVLIIALVVLVAMTLAAVALVRSVDTSNLIAGNMAFQQAATHSADVGFERAIDWLQNNKTGTTLEGTDTTNGYVANGADPVNSPVAGQTWDRFWAKTMASRAYSLAPDQASNAVSYVIDRMCKTAGPQSGAQCSDSPVVQAATGNAEEAGEIPLKAFSVVYYRITVRVAGPRNTVSYVQTMISM